jgi:hypothetical protein
MSRIQFAEPISKKEEVRPSRRDTRSTTTSEEKGLTQRTLSPGSEIVYPTGWRLILTTTGYLVLHDTAISG